MTALKEGGITMKHAKKKAAPKRAAKKNTEAKGFTPATAAAPAKDRSKKEVTIARISRPEGCTLDGLMKATNWQRHSIRGLLSTLGKSMTIESFRDHENGQRTYRLKGAAK